MKTLLTLLMLTIAAPAFACDPEHPSLLDTIHDQEMAFIENNLGPFKAVKLTSTQQNMLFSVLGQPPEKDFDFTVLAEGPERGVAQIWIVKGECIIDHSNVLPLAQIMAVLGEAASAR